MKLLQEHSDHVELVTEKTETGTKLYLEGIYMQANIKNGNGRIYEKHVLENGVDRYISEYVNNKRALGELNHPSRPYPDPAKAAILIESLSWEGNNVIGKALVLNTDHGRNVKGLIEGGFRMGVSSRALGSLSERNGVNYVNDDLHIHAVDCVDNASGPDCYPNIMTESTEWALNESSGLYEMTEKTQRDQIDYEKLFLDEFKKALK